MTVKIQFRLEGHDDLLRQLFGLQKGMRNQILRKALKAGARPVIDGAKYLAPRETGVLRRSIGFRMRAYRRQDVLVVVVGPRKMFEWRAVPSSWSAGGAKGWGRGWNSFRRYNPAKYSHLVEKGTKPHDILIRKGRMAGRVVRHPGARAQPFMLPTFLFRRHQVEAEIVSAIRFGLMNVARFGKP